MKSKGIETRVSTAQLVWNTKESRFSTEASSLGWPAGYWPTSVEVVSHVTGTVKTFYRVGPDVDGEGDLVAVRYEAHNLALVIFND
jgi:hypothetical protein